jgi:uncharacterized membrane protein affecting hemolysin expression
MLLAVFLSLLLLSLLSEGVLSAQLTSPVLAVLAREKNRNASNPRYSQGSITGIGRLSCPLSQYI